jgi:hypothetical protein
MFAALLMERKQRQLSELSKKPQYFIDIMSNIHAKFDKFHIHLELWHKMSG